MLVTAAKTATPPNTRTLKETTEHFPSPASACGRRMGNSPSLRSMFTGLLSRRVGLVLFPLEENAPPGAPELALALWETPGETAAAL